MSATSRSAGFTLRVLTAGDAPAYRAARLAALQSDPLAFITTAAEFAARPLESVTAQLAPRATSVTFGAFLGAATGEGELVGLLTVAREERPSIAHRANIFGVSVAAQARGQGIGDALLRVGTVQARTWDGVTCLLLGVTETQGAARRLYERHGFVVWGQQPDAVRHGGQSYGELHLRLEL